MEQQSRISVELTNKGVSLNGRHSVLLCGSLFYFRMPRAVWHDRIAKLKRTGYNCVDVYFPWNYHEKSDGSFDFCGERDVKYFLQELSEAGIYVIARPGPYICSEWNGGGLPARIAESGMPIRCADKKFISEVKKWYDAILPQIAPFSLSGGGTVILLQIENELDFFDCPNPQEYITELIEISKKHCPDIPHFCCAGQYGIYRAGGLTDGVEPTLNCYPSSDDNTFDGELQAYAHKLQEMNKPLLVSETNRDHFLLRRELSCGAKLLGAYNQVAGANLEYYQAVNNWGSPDALLATMYDFGSMIDPCGNYRDEANEALLFAAFLRAVGEPIAAAVPSEKTVQPKVCGFKTVEGGLRVLDLCGGGAAVCVPNFSDSDGEIEFSYGKHTAKGKVGSFKAPFWLFDYPLGGYGINAVLTYATSELIAASKEQLVFNGSGEIGIDFGSGEVKTDRDSEINGLRIKFVSGVAALDAAAREIGAGEKPNIKQYKSSGCGRISNAQLPQYAPVAGKGTAFGELSVPEGEICYNVKIPPERALYIEAPCDILRVDADGKRGETYFASGRDVYVAPSANGEYNVVATKWGHSNFDDSQSPCLRISCKKGVRSFGSVAADCKIGRCDFRLYDEFGADEIELDGGIPIRIGTDKWNSTRKPVICSYSLPVKRLAERLILKTSEQADVAVYINGKKVGECDYGKFELTPFVTDKTYKTLTLMYRKRVWTQDCGEARLVHIDSVAPVGVRAMTAAQMMQIGGGSGEVKLPLAVADSAALCFNIGSGEYRVKFTGENLLITGVADGRVMGRAIVNWKNAPALHGGEADELYARGKCKFYLYVQALAPDARLDGIQLLTT